MLAKINKIQHQRSGNFFLIAGPCAIEGEDITIKIAEKILSITNKLEIPFIFKASYRKANRSRLDSFSGIGDIEALKILKTVGERFNIPTITDIHAAEEAAITAQYVDILQIPSFLCRQTDLIVAAAQTGKVVNIKKGQFLSPESMIHAVNKVKESGNNAVMITERGTMFGYQDMVVDFRGIPTMQQFDVPVILDVTHSLQQPNQNSGITGGKPAMIETIAKAGIAAGSDGIFLETHPKPKNAKSDGENMLPLDQLEALLIKLIKIQQASR
ncbi:MAG: 3-deoxy-8-phosphooctulonate synthase [Flavobacteriales bacterium]|nr:3-deoxy-8-phosphooctulonate synthase [Flavobacteriales bacterium]|tara:strand:+ start:27106 stop:27918 length:813 start_codon:yes stop_codon:yes gene_type:complete